MASVISLYEWYLRGYVESLAKSTTPCYPKCDMEAAAAYALGCRAAAKGEQPQSRGPVERLVEGMIKAPTGD